MEFIREPGWAAALAKESREPYFAELAARVDAAYAAGAVYPPREKIFSAFEATPFKQVKAVIIGQDPYHAAGQAQGLAFYVPAAIKPPPSLVNIAKELAAEASGRDANSIKRSEVIIPDLRAWAAQGVLLLNTTLTVAEGQPLSHAGYGWERFTDAAIAALAARSGIAYLLWGAHAIKKGALVERTLNGVFECAHPSPLSARRGFFNSGIFRRVNEYLLAHRQAPIVW